MSIVAIFAIAFLLLTGLTFVIPSLPPGQLLFESLKIPQTTLSIWGISVAVLLNSITNGLIWGIAAAAVYGLSRHVNRRKSLPPMPVAPELATSPPKPTPLDWRADRYPPAITVRKPRGRIKQNIEMIEGIGSIRGRMLRNVGIDTVDDLLRVGATRLGRQRLARELGVAYTTVLRWVYRGDLLRVRGIGSQYSALLESAGVATVMDLSTRNARFLQQALKAVNREKRLVRRIPPRKTIEIWVRKAKILEPMVE